MLPAAAAAGAGGAAGAVAARGAAGARGAARAAGGAAAEAPGSAPPSRAARPRPRPLRPRCPPHPRLRRPLRHPADPLLLVCRMTALVDAPLLLVPGGSTVLFIICHVKEILLLKDIQYLKSLLQSILIVIDFRFKYVNKIRTYMSLVYQT